jgi:flagellar biosynthesis chaperone FliJ
MSAFQYSLQPILERVQWQLEAARIKLGALEQTVQKAQVQLAQVVDALHTAASEDSPEAREIDLARQRRQVAYLANIRQRIDERRASLAGLEAARDAQREVCLDLDKRLQIAQQHRKLEATNFAHHQARRALREADEAWLSRLGWREVKRSRGGHE